MVGERQVKWVDSPVMVYDPHNQSGPSGASGGRYIEVTRAKVLVICPTKDRPEFINALLQNLAQQDDDDIDLFIADMSTDPKLLEQNWFLQTGIQHYEKIRHRKVIRERVEGHNQLFGYQAGLKYALEHGYDLCVGTDDDIIFEPYWFNRGKEWMVHNPQIGVLVGYTLLPFNTLEEQTVPVEYTTHPDYQGNLKECLYYHCTLLDPVKRMKKFEQVYGPFWFRPKEVEKVGGFPTYLSPLGFRGEMMTQTALFFSGKELWLEPKMVCWHYSSCFGGLKLVQGDLRKLGLEHDMKIWNAFLSRGKPSVERPDGV